MGKSNTRVELQYKMADSGKNTTTQSEHVSMTKLSTADRYWRRFSKLFTDEIQKCMDNAVPVTTKKLQSSRKRLFSGMHMSTFLKNKLQNQHTTVEILRIHEDYVTRTMFTLTECLASPGATKFQNRYKKCQRKT